MLFALLILLTICPTTNLFFPLPISLRHSLMASVCILMAISNAWTLRCFTDSELKACIVVSCDIVYAYKYNFEFG